MSKVTVWEPPLAAVPEADRETAAEAALQVAAIVAQQYGRQTRIDFRQGIPSSVTLSADTRDVAIEDAPPGSPGQVRVEQVGSGPLLVVSGSGAGLAAASRTVGSSALALATAPAAGGVVGGNLPAVPTYSVDNAGERTVTLAQMGSTLTLEGVGTTSVNDVLTQAQFGSSVDRLAVHLKATYTPPPSGGYATFSVLVNKYIVASDTLNGSGVLSITAAVPATVLSRVEDITFRLDYSPPGGVCHLGLIPVQVTIDPSSGFVAGLGQLLPPGFERSPQNVANVIGVELVSVDDNTLEAASNVVSSLAQILPAAPRVEVGQAGSSSSFQTVLVVGATPQVAAGFGAPLPLAPFRTVPGGAGYRVDQPFAALEAFHHGGRDVILLGADKDRALLTVVGKEVLDLPGGWYGLGSGEIAFTTAAGKLRTVATGSAVSQGGVLPGETGGGVPAWLEVAIALVALAVAARITWLALRMARLRRKAAEAEENAEARGSG